MRYGSASVPEPGSAGWTGSITRVRPVVVSRRPGATVTEEQVPPYPLPMGWQSLASSQVAVTRTMSGPMVTGPHEQEVPAPMPAPSHPPTAVTVPPAMTTLSQPPPMPGHSAPPSASTVPPLMATLPQPPMPEPWPPPYAVTVPPLMVTSPSPQPMPSAQ